MAVAGGWLILGMASAWLPPFVQDTGVGEGNEGVTHSRLPFSLGDLEVIPRLLGGAHFPTGHSAGTSPPLPNSRPGMETE